jgi:upstream activation factor subunit UAF30
MGKQKNSAFMRPVCLTPELEAVVGKGPMPRTEVTKLLWKYIKSKNLQDPVNKRMINAANDAALKKVLKKDSINMFEMAKVISTHLSEKESCGCK